MELILNILLVLSGVALSLGILAVFAGIRIICSRSRLYLFFGLFSIFTGLYYIVFATEAHLTGFYSPAGRLLILVTKYATGPQIWQVVSHYLSVSS